MNSIASLIWGRCFATMLKHYEIQDNLLKRVRSYWKPCGFFRN